MSCLSRKKTPEDVEASRVSKEIETSIRQDRRNAANSIKLLLLGTPHHVILWIIAPTLKPFSGLVEPSLCPVLYLAVMASLHLGRLFSFV